MTDSGIRSAALVYQAGIANVFNTTNGERQRLLQADFRTCEAFARGLGAAGVRVTTEACSKAGDISLQDWSTDLDSQPFSDHFRPVFTNTL